MDNILNLKTHNKYLNLINEGLVIIPDNKLSSLIDDVNNAYRDKPIMKKNEVHEVTLKAGKKVRITSRGSLSDIEIDGITYDSIEQAACSIYDPYSSYHDLYHEIRENVYEFTLIPIVDPRTDSIRYIISKYSKGLEKYFDPKKVIKAVYTIDNILFYVKDNDDILRKQYFKIGAISLNDVLPLICKKYTERNGTNKEFYLAFFIQDEDLPFTIGACKEDFYCLKDILNKISFKGTTPLKYMLFRQLSDSPNLKLKEKEKLAYSIQMQLTCKNKKELCNELDITLDDYDTMMERQLLDIKNQKGKTITRHHITKYLHITENVNQLKFYEITNLLGKVKYNDIPDSI
jgi:hypothetical protein